MARRRAPKDGLATYRAKRNFAVTPEPAPEALAPPSGAPTFMVHKHDATRLHYDVRLEIDGALASWAVPKGPSYDSGIKRLAVQTEDHPLAYGGFEGRIPDGEYGGGDSIIWDRGTYDTVPAGQAARQREKGHLVIDLQGEKLRGRWHLVRTRPARGKPQWLMFKAKDGREASDYDVVAERPESVVSGRRVTRGPVRKKTLRAAHPEAEVLLASVWPPMLATLSSTEEVSAKTHLLEVKYDGFRALCALSGGKLAFQSRNQLDFRTRFPELARVLPRIQIGEAVIDAEVVALDDAGVSRFQAIADGGASHRLVAFDLLWLEGEDLRTRPLEERRELLESLLAHAPASIQLSERVEGEPDEALETARSRGWEGVIAKVRGSPYRAGRSREWLKLKAVAGQEVVVVGYTPISNGKAEVGALLVGLHEKDGFHYAGKVGTGFTAAARRTLLKQLKALEVKAPSVVNPPKERGARWVKPQLVAQISFAEWTRDGAMRHPSFQGLRDDKKPEDCVREPSTTPAPSEVPKATSRSGVGAKPIDVQVTHPDRVLFPQSGVTKGELFDYYRSVAAMMLPALRDRPLTLQQWPQGIDKEGFFRQNVAHAPEWLKTAAVQHDRRTVHHVLADTEPTLAWLANQSAITLHMMSSRAQSLGEPDWVVFDLDPVDDGFRELIRIARTLRGFLDELGLESVPKTSGKRGLHVLVPLTPGHTHQQSTDFAVAVTQALAQALPDISTTFRMKAKRANRLYLDAFQNGQGKTIVAPYSVRAVEGASVSTPLSWDEVTEALNPAAFTVRTLPKLLAQRGDLFKPALLKGQRLPRTG